MIIWTLLSLLLVDSTVGTPLREFEDDGKYGYQYDVKHPGGSSSVHVTSGNERSSYPSNFQHGDYISEPSYNDPTYVGPIYRPNRDRHYARSYPKGPSYGYSHSKVPVYEEHTYPRSPVYRSVPSHFSIQDRNHYGSYQGPSVISQSGIDAGSLYEKPTTPLGSSYSKPHFVQQVSIDEPIPDRFEQATLEPIAQKTLIKEFSEPSSYPLSKTPSYSKYEQSPIDQQVIIDEQSPIDQQVVIEEQSPIDQQVLVDDPTPVHQKVLIDEQSPIGQKVFVDDQSPIDQKILVDEQSPIDQKVLIDEQSPIDQQILVDKQSPIDQKAIVDEQSPFDQQIFVDEPKEIILQKPIEEKPELSQISIDKPSIKSVPNVKGTPIVQQSSLDVIPTANIGKSTVYGANKPTVVQQVTDDDAYLFSKKLPVTQKTIQHPSQAVYDSPIEPSFSDVDRHAPPQLYKTPPRYRFVPTGPPYEKISHFTKIIHAPPRPFYPPRTYYPYQAYPQKHIKTTFPVHKKPPFSYSIKYPPPPPPPRPVTKTLLPVNSPYSQKTINSNIFRKNAPIYPSVKLPPPPPSTKNAVPPPFSGVQYHVDPPIIQSVKLPPPAPVTKTVKSPVLSQVQEPVDEVIHSVKLPPPAPVTKIFTPPAQKHIDADVLHTKNPPISIKSPPPAPVTKTLAQAYLPEAQEHVDSDIISTKNLPVSSSVKGPPPPPPITKTIIAAPVSHPQQYVEEDVLTKNLPSPPVTKSVASVKLPPPPVTKSIANVKLPPPPVTKSVSNIKLPSSSVTKSVAPSKQESIDVDIVSKKYPPILQTVKTPPVSKTVVPVIVPQEQIYVDVPSTKNAPYSVKQPPVQVHQPVIFEKPAYVKAPFHSQKSIGSYQPKVPSVASYFNKPQYTDSIPSAPYTVKQPYSAPPVLSTKNTHYSDSELHLYVPSTKNSPPPHSVKYPVVSNVHSVKQPIKSAVAPNAPHVNPHFSALLAADGKRNEYSDKQPHSSPSYESSDSNYPEDGPIKKYTPDFDDAPYLESGHEEGYGPNIPPGSSSFDESAEEKSPFDKYQPVSHAIRLPGIIPKVETILDDNHSVDGIGESSPLDKYPPVSHSVILPVSPKSTSVPNLFAAVPALPAGSDDPSAPKSEALINPVSHSVRLPLPIQGNNYKNHEKSDDSKEKFPAFPVESALKQPDPVAEKVAELSNSFTPGERYENSNSDPNESNAPSIEEAKAEIERLNREIGRPFGSRLARRSNSGFVRIR